MMESDSEKENKDVPEFPEVGEAVPVKFVESQRGNPMLVDPFNYVYEKDKTCEDTIRWRCTRKRSKIHPRQIFHFLIFLC
jgi:hypothetical protein